jgi:hypothetical protein
VLRPALRLLPALALIALPGCGDAEDAAAAPDVAPTPAPAGDARAERARARVDALVDAPSPATLLAVLAAGHADARALLGRHRLHYRASFALTPEQLPARAVVGEPAPQAHAVVDELTLLWAPRGDEPALHLAQTTDKGEGREVVVLGEQVYTRMAHRGWQQRALDSELHLTWLDEAQHCVHDVVELAAPALAVEVQATGDDLTVVLTKAGAVDPARVAGGHGREWRQRTEITAVSGTLTLSRATGLWSKAEVAVSYVVRDGTDRPQRGETQLTGEVEPLAADVVVAAPGPAVPVPERTRYEVERQELLGGLAGS